AAHRHAAGASGVPGESESRRYVADAVVGEHLVNGNYLRAGYFLLERRAATQQQVRQPADVHKWIAGEIPTRAQIQREVRLHLPVVLHEEAVGLGAVAVIFKRRAAVARIEVDVAFLKGLVLGEIKHVGEAEIGPHDGTGERRVVPIAKNLETGLKSVRAAIEGRQVPPVKVILDKNGGAEADAKSGHPRDVDARNSGVGSLPVPQVAHVSH